MSQHRRVKETLIGNQSMKDGGGIKVEQGERERGRGSGRKFIQVEG